MNEVKNVIEKYARGSATGDIDLLREVFFEGAVMSGNLSHVQLVCSSPEIFFNDVAGMKSKDYSHVISNIQVVDRIATATLEEKGLGGKTFINYFHLVKVEEQWKITSKLFKEMVD